MMRKLTKKDHEQVFAYLKEEFVFTNSEALLSAYKPLKLSSKSNYFRNI